MRDGKRTWNGITIPYILKDFDEKPSFAELDPLKIREVLHKGLCGLCGFSLSARNAAWVGGSRHFRGELFGDPPMHIKCAHYAIKMCPFLKGENRSDDEDLWVFHGEGIFVEDLLSKPVKIKTAYLVSGFNPDPLEGGVQ